MRKASTFVPRQVMNRTDFEILHMRDTYLKDVELHHHDFFEIFFLISGDVSYTIESRVYHLMPGDLLLISPKELHQICIRNEISAYERFVLWVDPQMLQRMLEKQGFTAVRCAHRLADAGTDTTTWFLTAQKK